MREVLPHLASDAPIVASVTEALQFAPTALLIGTAPERRRFAAGVARCRARGDRGTVGNCQRLARNARRGSRVPRRGARRRNDHLGRAPAAGGAALFGDVYDVEAPILLTVGNDCAVGKMTVSLELVRAANRAGKKARFVPTGQTGVLIAGWGISVDRVIADFAAGAAERLVLYAAHEGADLIVVEGQGAINHPAYAPVTLALMTGCAPDALVLVCDPRRTQIESYPTRTLRYDESIALHERLLQTLKPAEVIGIALNTHGIAGDDARAEIERARNETGLPTDDLVRFGPDRFYGAIAHRIVKRPTLPAACT